MNPQKSEDSYHSRTWQVMSELDGFPSKLIIVKHLLESVQTSIIKKDVKLAEYLLDAAQDLVEHYTSDFEKKFQTAWHQTIQIANVADKKTSSEKEQTPPTSILSCDSNDPSPECKGQWTDFWESDDCNYNDNKRTNPFAVKQDNGSWTVPIEETPDGEYLVTFPDELVNQVGWNEGDTLEWIDNEDGTFTLKKV